MGSRRRNSYHLTFNQSFLVAFVSFNTLDVYCIYFIHCLENAAPSAGMDSNYIYTTLFASNPFASLLQGKTYSRWLLTTRIPFSTNSVE